MRNTAFAAELESQLAAADPDVPVTQRGEAERAVGAGVLLVADPDQGALQEPHQRRQHLLPRQAGLAQILGNAAADPRQAARRNPTSGRTWRHRGGCAIQGDSGTACGRGRRGRSPAGGRADHCRSTHPGRPGGMASLRIRVSRAGSAILRPPGAMYENWRPRRTRRMPGLQSLVNSRLIEDTPQDLLLPPGRQLPVGRGTRQAHCIGQGRVLVGECSHRLGRRTAKYVPPRIVNSANTITGAHF